MSRKCIVMFLINTYKKFDKLLLFELKVQVPTYHITTFQFYQKTAKHFYDSFIIECTEIR